MCQGHGSAGSGVPMETTPQSNCNHALSGSGPSPSSNAMNALGGGSSTHLPQHQQLPQRQPLQAAAGTMLNSSAASQTSAKNNSFNLVSE